MSDNEQRNENRETVADIVAELRKESKKVRTVIRPDGYGDYEKITLEGNPYLKNLSDRIEEAWKREKAEIEADALAVGGIVEAARTAEKSSAVGNAAAMREALETMNKLFEQGVICTSYANSAEEMEQIEELYRKAKSALSAPARNCDRYEDAPSAYADFIVSWKLDGHLDDVPSLQDFAKTLQDFANWLFAPSSERKGEGDGR